MRMLRTALAVGTVSLLTAGYALSQLRFFQGRWQEYAEQVDKPPVAYLATALLLVIVVLSFVREPEAGEP
jgi:hypothetical protein